MFSCEDTEMLTVTEAGDSSMLTIGYSFFRSNHVQMVGTCGVPAALSGSGSANR